MTMAKGTLCSSTIPTWNYVDMPLVERIRKNRSLQLYEETHSREARALNVNRSAVQRATQTNDQCSNWLRAVLIRCRQQNKAQLSDYKNESQTSVLLPKICQHVLDEHETYQWPFYKQYVEAKLQEKDTLEESRSDELNLSVASTSYNSSQSVKSECNNPKEEISDYVILPAVTTLHATVDRWTIDRPYSQDSVLTIGKQNRREDTILGESWSLPGIKIGAITTITSGYQPLTTHKSNRYKPTRREMKATTNYNYTKSTEGIQPAQQKVELMTVAKFPRSRHTLRKSRVNESKEIENPLRDKSVLLIKPSFSVCTSYADKDTHVSRLNVSSTNESQLHNSIISQRHKRRHTHQERRENPRRWRRFRRRASARRWSVNPRNLCVISRSVDIQKERFRARRRKQFPVDVAYNTEHSASIVDGKESETATEGNIERKTSTFIHVKIPTGSSFVMKSSMKQRSATNSAKKVVQFGSEFVHEVSNIDYWDYDSAQSVCGDDVGDLGDIDDDDDNEH